MTYHIKWGVTEVCKCKARGTWHVAEMAVVERGQGEAEGDVLGALVVEAHLHEQRGARGLEVEAVLQHGRLRGGRFGGQVDGHEVLELLAQLLGGGPPAQLCLTPRALQPVQ